MISADIPMTMTSTADLSLSIDEFIEYSIKNDLNIVTTKWLAHTRVITITESRASMKRFWESIGKDRGYCATFSVLFLSESDGYSLELVDSENIPTSNLISSEIFAIHAVPIKDKSVQFGLINVPIFDLAGEIEAPWIDSNKFPKIETCDEVALKISEQKLISEEEEESIKEDEITSSSKQAPPVQPQSKTDSQPPEKKMKMVPTVRTFMHNGYQMTEVVNEHVPCDGAEDTSSANSTTTSKPTPDVSSVPAKSKQSSMMNFFKKK